jgi:hypothetical protein
MVMVMVVVVVVFVITIIIIIIIFVIVIVIVMFSMQGIYNHIPETHHVSRVYNIAGILYLQYVIHVMLFPMLNVLYFYMSTF